MLVIQIVPPERSSWFGLLLIPETNNFMSKTAENVLEKVITEVRIKLRILAGM